MMTTLTLSNGQRLKALKISFPEDRWYTSILTAHKVSEYNENNLFKFRARRFFQLFYLYCTWFTYLNQRHIKCLALFAHTFGPDASLNFTDVCFAQIIIQRRDCPIPPPIDKWKCVIHQSFVEVKIKSFSPSSLSWRTKASLSTRIPIDDNSMALCNTSFHSSKSPFSPG